MEGREKPHTHKYKEITNDWNYDTSCMLMSLPVQDLENFKRLTFVTQSVHFIEFGIPMKLFRPIKMFKLNLQ
jgi:hypothetical protein